MGAGAKPIAGLGRDLPPLKGTRKEPGGKRSVRLFKMDDGSYRMEFRTGRRRTRLALTSEAMDALVALRRKVDGKAQYQVWKWVGDAIEGQFNEDVRGAS